MKDFNEKILAMDIGSGTQDILIYKDSVEMENNYKMVMPSQTSILASRIEELTQQGKDIYIEGTTMGGGPVNRAVKSHLETGNRVWATEKAALTLKDNLDKVKAYGVEITDSPPETAAKLEFKDIDLQGLQDALKNFDISLPGTIAVAVQDHGFSPHESNRLFRFHHWQNYLKTSGYLRDLIYQKEEVPGYFTRMNALGESIRDGFNQIFMMDTGAAAILGCLEDPWVAKHVSHRGGLLVNVGNQHIIAFLVYQDRVFGIFEHHTAKLSQEKLDYYLKKFRQGELSNEEVVNDHGHGAARKEPSPNLDFEFVAITGPRREIGKQLGYMAAPYGDMMLTGCYGLVKGIRERMHINGN